MSALTGWRYLAVAVVCFSSGAICGYVQRKKECGVEHPAGCTHTVEWCRNVVGDPHLAAVTCPLWAELTYDERTGLAYCVCPPGVGPWP